MQTVSRLIDNFIPEHYSLSLTLNRTQRSFQGVMTVTGTLQPDIHELILHAKDLVIDSVIVDGKVASFAQRKNDELAITHSDLVVGDHIVVVGYSGVITDPMHGLYPCYFEHEGIKKELLATQFESHHAREVFPCIDEPEAKATFDVTLTTEQNVTVLGNMPIKKQDVQNDLLVTSFFTTPRMSSYLVAWVVGDLHSKTAYSKRGVEVSIWATPAQAKNSLDFALDIAVRSIDFYEEYFDTNYPLPKADHVALPDFSAGAMENWGLITYRETSLLANPATTSISSRQYMATVIAHELAHQWFGNLVTMKWWNNLWLNESFASFMVYLAIDSLHPEWNIWLDFTTDETLPALRRDSIDGVQPVQIDVNHPDQIGTLFDGAIVYAKGARLLYMLYTYVGDKAFHIGLKQYFKNYAFGNTEANDLWNAIAKASGKNIVELMNTWISQPGYPVIHASQVDGLVHLSQERFFASPHDESDSLWPIPLTSTCSEMPTLFETKEITVPRHHTTPLRFNVGDSAHFITHYDKPLLKRLLERISTGEASVIDRIQLLNEMTLLARGGIIPSADLIDVLRIYKDETSEHVWTIIFIALSELRKFVEDDEVAERALRTLSAAIARSQYERLGWTARDDENESDTKLRGTILSLMLYGEDKNARASAKKLYQETAIELLDPELRPLILSSVVRNSDETIVDELLARYKSSQSGELRQDLCVGLTSTKNPAKIRELLDLILNSEIIRPQDVGHWFVYLIRGFESRDIAWQWMEDNWTWIETTFSGDKSYDDYPRYSASGLSTRNQLEKYIDFFTPMQNIPALTRVITMGITEIEGRVNLIERDGPAVKKALLDL